MGKVFGAHAVSVDGYITGGGPGPGHGLGDGGLLFDWYFSGDTPSAVFDGFKLSAPSARVFDDVAGRVGAVVAGRNTYEDSDRFGGGSPHPTAPLVLLSHRPAPGITERQTLVTTGIEDAVLGGGRPFFRALPAHVRLRLLEVVPAPGVTHLRYAVENSKEQLT